MHWEINSLDVNKIYLYLNNASVYILIIYNMVNGKKKFCLKIILGHSKLSENDDKFKSYKLQFKPVFCSKFLGWVCPLE